MTPLDGYKTYIVAAVGIGIAVMFYLRGDIDAAATMQNVLIFLGMGAVRHGITLETNGRLR
jgi:hypothetical protein